MLEEQPHNHTGSGANPKSGWAVPHVVPTVDIAQAKKRPATTKFAKYTAKSTRDQTRVLTPLFAPILKYRPQLALN